MEVESFWGNLNDAQAHSEKIDGTRVFEVLVKNVLREPRTPEGETVPVNHPAAISFSELTEDHQKRARILIRKRILESEGVNEERIDQPVLDQLLDKLVEDFSQNCFITLGPSLDLRDIRAIVLPEEEND